MKITHSYLYISIFSILISCGGNSSTDDATEAPMATPEPSAATLIFPANNTECNEGEVLTNDATKSAVIFRWDSSENTDSYEVNLRNLNSNFSTRTNAATNEASITLDRGTPYEWFVVSKANGTITTASSATAKFFNQGPGIENFAPFPADVLNPKQGLKIPFNTTVNLQWSGSDIDNDIEDYIIIFDSLQTPTTEIGTTTNTNFDATISAAGIYYWRVITRDSQNNSSQSEIFQFAVNN